MDNPDYSGLDYAYIYRASSLGGCLKQQAAAQLGYSAVEVPDFFKGVFSEGRLHEDAIVKDLVESGLNVFDRELQVVLPVNRNIAVVGHIDGKLSHGLEVVSSRLLEMKTMSSDAYKSFAANGWDDPGLIAKYKYQVSVYMHATGLPCTMIAKNRNNGRHIHMDINEPFYSLTDIRARVLKVHSYVVNNDLPVRCDPRSFPCPFPYLHEDDDEDQPEAGDVELVRAAAVEYRKARDEVGAAKERADKAREELMKVMGGQNSYKGIVSKYEKAGPGKWNVELMREDGVDVEKYKVRDEKKHWEVRLAKEDEGEVSDGERQ